MEYTKEIIKQHANICASLDAAGQPMHGASSVMLDQLLKRIDQLEKENSSLKKDAARLDWIDKVGEVHICRVREGSVSGNLRWDVEYGYYEGLAKSKKGMRQAIDIAMQNG